MNRLRLFVVAIGIAVVWTGTAMAQTRYLPKRPKEPLGNNPNPVIWGGQSSKSTTSTPSRPSQQAHPKHHGRHRHAHVHPSRCVDASYFWLRLWRSSSCFGGYYRYPLYHFPQIVPQRVTKPIEPPAPRQTVERATNAVAVERARKFIGYGDALFAQGKYAEANIRYRKAARAAPQLADPLFRQAFALAATNRYELAARAVQRGLTLDERWPTETGFSLDVLFQDNEDARSEQIESLIAASERRPQDADLQFLVGVHLYFDGQAAGAVPFLRAAASLSNAHAPYVAAFL